MTDTEIFESLKRIINKQFGIDEEKIEEESYLDGDLNISELDMEDLLSTIEEKYDIKFPAETSGTFNKVSDLVAYIYENADTSN